MNPVGCYSPAGFGIPSGPAYNSPVPPSAYFLPSGEGRAVRFPPIEPLRLQPQWNGGVQNGVGPQFSQQEVKFEPIQPKTGEQIAQNYGSWDGSYGTNRPLPDYRYAQGYDPAGQQFFEGFQECPSPLVAPLSAPPVFTGFSNQTNFSEQYAPLSAGNFYQQQPPASVFIFPPLSQQFPQGGGYAATVASPAGSPSEPPSPARSCPGKRQRTAFTTHQLMVLEESYKQNKFIKRVQRILIANQLGLSEKIVKVWYQNKRMKDKQDAAKASKAKASGSPPKAALPSADCAVVREILLPALQPQIEGSPGKPVDGLASSEALVPSWSYQVEKALLCGGRVVHQEVPAAAQPQISSLAGPPMEAMASAVPLGSSSSNPVAPAPSQRLEDCSLMKKRPGSINTEQPTQLNQSYTSMDYELEASIAEAEAEILANLVLLRLRDHGQC